MTSSTAVAETGARSTNTTTNISSTTTTPLQCLQSLVEERLTSLLRDAASVQRHAKRARLHPVPGGGVVVKRRLHASDVNMALQLRDSEPLYGTAVSANTGIINNNNNNTGGANTNMNSTITSPNNNDNSNNMMTVTGDNIILDLAEFVRQPVITQPPSEVAASMHWLAVQGQVPDIPQNVASNSNSNTNINNPGTAAPVGSGGGGTSGGSPSAVSRSSATNRNNASSNNYNRNNPLQVQQLQMAVLSEELQLYYTHVTLALESSKNNNMDAIHTVLQSLANDRGLQELVPFLMHYSETALLRQVDHSVPVIQMILALLQNPHVHLELHFDKVIKPLMTCIVITVRRKNNNNTADQKGQRRSSSKPAAHWAIRQWASLTVVTACRLFREYSNFRSSVLQLICQALEPTKSLPTRYGGLITLRQFGPKVVDAIGVNVISQYWPLWQQAMLEEDDKKKNYNPERAEAIVMCLQASVEALFVYFQGISVSEQMNRQHPTSIDWYDVLGDAVTPMTVMAEENQFAYATCFI